MSQGLGKFLLEKTVAESSSNSSYRIEVGEALEECRKLDACSIDLILTDPPFNHETEQYDTRQDKFRKVKMKKTFADFAIMRQYFAEVAREFGRIIKPKGRLLLFCDCYSHPVFWSAFYGEFEHLRALIWYKGKNYFPLGVNQAFRYSYEMILHGFNNDSWLDRGQRQDVLTFKNVPVANRYHPAQKPLPLLMTLITATCPKNGLVLDPYMGSGSTLLAAKHLERNAIGFDANPSFVEISRRRLGEQEKLLDVKP